MVAGPGFITQVQGGGVIGRAGHREAFCLVRWFGKGIRGVRLPERGRQAHRRAALLYPGRLHLFRVLARGVSRASAVAGARRLPISGGASSERADHQRGLGDLLRQPVQNPGGRLGLLRVQRDEALPTTVALAEHYGVSQATVTRVLRTLAAEGLVRTVPRWGTFRA